VWNQRNSIVEFLRGSDHIREHLLGCTFGIAPLQAMPFIEKVLGRPSAKIRASYGFKKILDRNDCLGFGAAQRLYLLFF
jgi:hypothetical protein